MVVGVLSLVMYLPGNRSLKGKRSVVKAIKAKVSNRYNVSVAEIDRLDDVASIGLVVVQAGNEKDHVDRCLRTVARFVESLRLAQPGEEEYIFDNY